MKVKYRNTDGTCICNLYSVKCFLDRILADHLVMYIMVQYESMCNVSFSYADIIFCLFRLQS